MKTEIAATLTILLLALSTRLAAQDTVKVKAATRNPHGAISIACDACHGTGDWSQMRKDMVFDHNAQTDFVLEGQHRSGTCKSCHANFLFAGAKKECYQCHADIHKGQLGKQCEQCHTSKGWQPLNFSTQHNMTRFPLIGVHAVTACQSCHKNQQEGEFKGLAVECVSCHINEYRNSTNPNHAQSHIPTNCDGCHTPKGWSPALIFDHGMFGFELTLGHSSAAKNCEVCHGKNNFKLTNDCGACHQKDFDRAANPKHLQGQFSTNCMQCHTTIPGWKPARFDHTVTQFPMTGAHAAAQNNCVSCHASGYVNTSTLCYSCHKDAFNKTTNPNHVTSTFATTCQDCHSTIAWSPSTFDHNKTPFPLTGAHQTLTCIQCHAKGYTGTTTDCYSCHLADYNKTTNPNHVTNSFPTTCAQCHGTTAWSPSIFNHNATPFPLTGAHLAVTCIQCHSKGYTGTPTDCYACHQADYTKTTSPNHALSNFPTTCTTCHSTTAWSPSTFNHNTSLFPLTGAHVAVTCIQCHSKGYVGTPTDCYSCHQSAYNTAANPNHPGLIFPKTCQTGCHNTTAWQPSSFNHATYTGYSFQGAHVSLAAQCAQCHVGNLTSAGATCYPCHKASYDNSLNPNHIGSNFSTDCQTCHNQNVWKPWTKDHNIYFPIASGAHTSGVWTGCGGGSGDGAGCHTNNNNYRIFSCVHCHNHSSSLMSPPTAHNGVSGYTYNSQACYTCHPNGSH